MNSWRGTLFGPPSVRGRFDNPDSWDRRYARVLALLPYVLLAVSTLLSQTQPYRTVQDRLVVLGLAALAAAWLLLLYTLPPPRWRERTSLMVVYFAGLLVLSALLEARSMYFIAFVVTGFIQAFFVLPTVLAFAGIATTSCVLYLSIPDSGFRSLDALPQLAFIVGLQTAVIGGGGFLSARGSEQHARQRQLLAELQAAQEENAGLHAQLLVQAREAGVLDERQRLAREIHDTLAQSLTGIVTQLEAAEAASSRSEQWQAHVERASALARESLYEARRSLRALQPQLLEGSRLPDAIADLSRRWSETSSVPLTFETIGAAVPLLPDLEITLFRVAQEALANVAKHASASRVGLTISYTDDLVLLDARDDGVGFIPGAADGFGLRAMEQRLRLIGGRLEIESAPGAGTAVGASVPAIAVSGADEPQRADPPSGRSLAAAAAPGDHDNDVRPARGEDVPPAARSWRAAFWGRPPLQGSFDNPGPWERRYARVLALLPYALLAVSTLLSQTQPYRTVQDRLVVLGLAALAAAWLLLLYTLPPPSWRERTGLMLVYFTGLLVLSALLEARSAYFVAFVVAGFFQAFFLLPTALAFAGTAATSCLLYLAPPDSPFRTLDALPQLAFFVGLQTVTAGGGSFMGAKISEQYARQRRLLAELQAAQEENAGLHAQLLVQARDAGVLDERQRLAREIHDTLAQGLTGIVTQLEAAEVAGSRPEQWQAHVERATALARESLHEARRSLRALQPQLLEGSRLPDAIADLSRRWSETSSVPLTFETIGAAVPLLPDLEITLFRVAQEALANVAKHASASRVGLTISYTDDLVLLDVRDDGVGFIPGAADGFGLPAMEQRLRLIGGRLEIESAPGAGTAVSASVPAIAASPA